MDPVTENCISCKKNNFRYLGKFASLHFSYFLIKYASISVHYLACLRSCHFVNNGASAHVPWRQTTPYMILLFLRQKYKKMQQFTPSYIVLHANHMLLS